MELIKQTYKGINSTPIKTLNNLFNVIEGCFPYIFFDKEDIFATLKNQGDSINLYYHNDILIGFICHKNIDKNTVCINYLGVNQNKKRYTEQGFASKMLEDFINQNPNKEIHLLCNASNDRARYLYQKFNFEIVEHNISDLEKKQYHMVLNTNKKHTTIASIIYEIYKLKLKKPDNTIEEIFLDMFNNQKYDNLYQYNISDNEINHTIKHSLLFAQSLSILDDILSFNKFNSNKNIFSHVCSDLDNYISGESTTYIENKNLNKFNVKKLIKIFSLLDIKFRDDKECLEIKRK